MVILNAIESIFSIVIMIVIGYILTEKKWFNEDISQVFVKLVINVSLPGLMISDVLSAFDKDKLSHLSRGLVVPFLSMAICYIIAIAVSRLIKVPKERRGLFRSMFFVSNTIFIGLPVNQALFGPISIPYVLLYYIANTTFFWTIGVYGISKDGDQCKSKIFSINTLKRIFSPPLMGFTIAILFVFIDIKLPKFIMDSCRYLGNLTTPLSMIFIGITIHSVKLKDIHISMDMIILMLGRFLISPLIVLFLIKIYPIPKMMANVFIIQAAMPVMTNSTIVSKAYNADYEYATIMTVITTLLSLFVIPIYMGILG